MSDEPGPAARIVRGIMPRICGYLEKVNELSTPVPNITVRTVLPGGAALRVRAKIGVQTVIARGTEPVDASRLREGEFVEVSYRYGKEGRLDAHMIYIRPDQTLVD
jgi:hypothetical protein